MLPPHWPMLIVKHFFFMRFRLLEPPKFYLLKSAGKKPRILRHLEIVFTCHFFVGNLCYLLIRVQTKMTYLKLLARFLAMPAS